MEITPKCSPILELPQKKSTKSSYPPKKKYFSEPPPPPKKNKKKMKFKIMNQKNDPSLRMFKNIRVPPPLGDLLFTGKTM